MSEPGPAAATGDGTPAPTTATSAHTPVSRTAPLVLAGLGLVWLGVTLWLAHGVISGSSGIDAVSAAALVVPSVVAASLLAGAGSGLLAAARPGRPGTGVRVALGAAAALVPGVVAAALVVAGYGARGPILLLAGALAVAAVTGGALAALPPRVPATAGLAAALAATGSGLLLDLARPGLKDLFGAGRTVASQVDATVRLSYAVSLVVAVVAGLVAYGYQRRREPSAHWSRYLLAGAAPGLLLLTAELLTRIGTGRLMALAGTLSPGDSASLAYVSASRLNHALVVLFAGAMVTVIMRGRSMSPTDAGTPDGATPPTGPGRDDTDTPTAVADGDGGGSAARDGAAPPDADAHAAQVRDATTSAG